MKTTLFAVIDTNVIVSALISTNPESPPFIIMAHVYAGSIIPVYYRRLAYPSPHNATPLQDVSPYDILLKWLIPCSRRSPQITHRSNNGNCPSNMSSIIKYRFICIDVNHHYRTSNFYTIIHREILPICSNEHHHPIADERTCSGHLRGRGDDDGFFLKNRYLRTVVFTKKLCILLDLT